MNKQKLRPRRAEKTLINHSPVQPRTPPTPDPLPVRPRPLLGDKAGLEVQVSRGRFAGFFGWICCFFGGDKAAGGSRGERSPGGAMGHMRSLRCFHSGLQPVPYFGEEAERNAGLRLGTGVWGEPTNPSGGSQPVFLPRRGLQEPGSAPYSGLSPPVIRIFPPQDRSQRWQRAGKAQVNLSVTAGMDGGRR